MKTHGNWRLVLSVAAVVATAPAQAGVKITSGKTVIPSSWTWTIETNKVGEGEVWWTTGRELAYNGRRIGLEVIPQQMFDNIDLAFLKTLPIAGSRLPKESLKP